MPVYKLFIYLTTAMSFSVLANTQGDAPNNVLSTSTMVQLGADEYSELFKGMPLEELENYLSSPGATNDIVLDYHSFIHLEKRARESSVAADPQVQFDMQQAMRKVLVSAYMNQQMDSVQPIEDDNILKERYVALKDYFRTPERRSFSHILLRDDVLACGWADEAAATAAERAELVLKKLNSGEEFAEVAADFSDDVHSAVNGGKLPGSFSRQSPELDKTFLTAGYEIKQVGEYSPAIRTINGLHIIRLDEIEPPRVIPFSEARESVKATVYSMQRDSKLQEIKSTTYPRPNQIELQKIIHLGNAILEERKAEHGNHNE